jgi:methanogenic corrinoid protein MtbC1
MFDPKTANRAQVDDSVRAAFLDRLLDGDSDACLAIVSGLLDRGVDLRDLYDRLFRESMYRVGELWETAVIPVAVEHLASAITGRCLSLVYPLLFATEHRDRRAVVACVADEYHQLGAQMVADLFEFRGWHGHFLGANTSIATLLAAVKEHRPHVVGLSLSIPTHLPRLVQAMEALGEAFPDVPVLLGGQAFRWGIDEELRADGRVRIIHSLTEADEVMHA